MDDLFLIPVDGSLLGCQEERKAGGKKEKRKALASSETILECRRKYLPMAPKRIICHKTEGAPRAYAGSSQQHDPRTTLPGPSPHHAATLLLPLPPFPRRTPMHTFISGPIPAVGRPFFSAKGADLSGGRVGRGVLTPTAPGGCFSPHTEGHEAGGVMTGVPYF